MKLVKVAVTGGIGSGKSFVLKIIESLGYPMVSCDKIYAELLNEERFVLKVCDEMGVEPLCDNGKLLLNRSAISEKVFNDKNLLNKLNQLTHGAILDRAFSLYDSGLIFYEVPLLFEGGYQNKFDYVFVVLRGKEERISSAMLRDGALRNEIERKMNNQFSSKMNLDGFKKKLVASTASIFSWDEVNADEKSTTLSTLYMLPQFDDLLKIFVDVDKEGFVAFTIVFDKIDYTHDTLKLVNYFNANVPFLKAYVEKARREYYLKIQYNCLVKSEDEAVAKFEEFFGILANKGIATYLKPLTVITEE